MSEENPIAKKPKRGLGRGLNALFDDDEVIADAVDSNDDETAQPSVSGRAKQMAGIEFLQPGTLQPRQHFDEDALQQLADSIKVHGLLQPILVRPVPGEEGYYEIIAGERRWRAAQKAQLHQVPIIPLELSDIEALEIALIENLQREDLNAVDEARGYQKLMEDYGHTQEKLAEALGKSRSYIANMVRLLQLPGRVLKFLEEGDLSVGHARALITAKDPEELAKAVVSRGLSVRETEKLAAETSDAPRKSKSSAQSSAKSSAKSKKDVDTLALEDEISNALGMRVSIDTKDGKQGTLKVEFKDLDQLDEVLHRLSHYPGSRLSG